MKLIIGDLIKYKDKDKIRVAIYLGEYQNKLIVEKIKGKKRNIVLIDKTDVVFKYISGFEK